MADTAIVRENFGSTELEKQTEINIAAQMEEARRMVESRFIVAMRKPREYAVVRQRILNVCKIPGFAAKARYSRPVGRERNKQTGRWEQKNVTGWSIRFAERMVAIYGNLDVSNYIIADTDEKASLRSTAIDLETNSSWSSDTIIDKRVERKEPGQRKVHGWRDTSEGGKVALVDASPDEVRQKIAIEKSKGGRDNILRLLPFELLEEAEQAVAATNSAEIKRDPLAVQKKIADRFQARGVSADQVVAYLEHGLDTVTREEIQELATVANFLDEGGSWQAVMDAKNAPVEEEPKDK